MSTEVGPRWSCGSSLHSFGAACEYDRSQSELRADLSGWKLQLQLQLLFLRRLYWLARSTAMRSKVTLSFSRFLKRTVLVKASWFRTSNSPVIASSSCSEWLTWTGTRLNCWSKPWTLGTPPRGQWADLRGTTPSKYWKCQRWVTDDLWRSKAFNSGARLQTVVRQNPSKRELLSARRKHWIDMHHIFKQQERRLRYFDIRRSFVLNHCDWDGN